MSEVRRRHLQRSVGIAALVGACLVAAAAVSLHAQQRFELYVFAWDEKGVPVLDLKGPEGGKSDISVKEPGGEARVMGVRRFGWPLKVTLMIDNGAKARVMLPFVREGLTKFIDTMPKDEKGMGLISLSLLTTAPAPRFLVRDSKDYAEFKKSVGQISPEPDDGAFGRFSDSLVEYSRRLDDEFRTVGPEQLPPYLPILISVSTTTQDGSDVRGLDVKNMIVSLVRHRVSTNFVMVNPSKSANINDGVNELTVDADAAQIGEIANAVRDATHGQYFALGGSGSSSIASKHLPDLATQVSYRFIKQMFQHQVIVERAAGVTTPLSVKDIGLSINRPGVQYQFAFDPFIP